jgi:adenosylmethionine-8-amino-7-oxononanoate aminotransferase
MIVDDVALCWGKMGTMFGYQAYGVQPDISALGKALTAGYSPLGAAVCNKRVSDVLSRRSWDHGHTWAPNMQGVAAALASTKKIENLLSRTPVIQAELKAIAESLGVNYRGDGLFACFDMPRLVTLAELSECGMAATIPGINCVKIIAPLIADAEYFQELKTRLQRLF